MARGVNKVIIVGNLGQDPDFKQLPSGGAVTNISVATTDSWTDNQGERQDRTEWHRVVLFSRLAEVAGQYLRKGSHVYIEGSIRTRQWEKDGVKRYTTEIVARDMQMLGVKNNAVSDYDNPDNTKSFNKAGPQDTPQKQSASQSNVPETDFGDLDDDLPF